MSEKRTLRADAVRNRERVLEVAQEVFATEGLAVPIDKIARRAGLGVGTLYRHFPTKEALFEAIVLGHLERSIAECAALAAAKDPGAAFFGFLARISGDMAKKKDFLDALARTSEDFKRALGDRKKELGRGMSKLLARAQASGAVREDVEIREVMALVIGMSTAVERLGADESTRARLIDVLCDGLRGRTRRR